MYHLKYFILKNGEYLPFTHASKGGAGGVARSRLHYLGAWSKPYEGISDPLITEVLALRDGEIFAKLCGFKRVAMETDCLA